MTRFVQVRARFARVRHTKLTLFFSTELGLFNGLCVTRLVFATPKPASSCQDHKAIRGAAAPLVRKEPFQAGRKEFQAGRKEIQIERKEIQAGRKEFQARRKEIQMSISAKAKSFNGLRPTPAGSLGVARFLHPALLRALEHSIAIIRPAYHRYGFFEINCLRSDSAPEASMP
jgi:hypothetical protein